MKSGEGLADPEKKNKDPSKPMSYRPISLTSNLGKVYEMIINNHIVKFCSDNNLIHDLQFGFRAKHSTTHAVHKLLDIICKHLKKNQRVAAVLIDMEKAFDPVWINGLLFKLKRYGFPGWLLLLITDMISGRTF